MARFNITNPGIAGILNPLDVATKINILLTTEEVLAISRGNNVVIKSEALLPSVVINVGLEPLKIEPDYED